MPEGLPSLTAVAEQRRVHDVRRHAAFHNHFNQERHFVSRDIYRERRLAVLAEWQRIAN